MRDEELQTNGTAAGDAGNGTSGGGSVVDGGGEPTQQSSLGDAVGLLSAVGYGWYTVQLRLYVREGEADAEGERHTSGGDGDSTDTLSPLPFGAGAGVSADASASASTTGGGGGAGVVTGVTPQAKPIPMNLVLGYVGVIVLVLGLPAVLLCAINCWDDFCSLTSATFAFIILLAFANNFLSEYFWARCILLTTPTVATVGLSLTIPMAFCIDLFFTHAPGSGSVLGALGAAVTVLGFLFVNVEDKSWKRLGCC
jgi:drug/metabolite transporter (DMT)-like permease